MADQKTTVVQQPARTDQPATPGDADKANALTGGEKGKKAPAPGTDARPQAEVQHQDLRVPPVSHPVYEKVEKGKLGDGGPSSDASGKNAGNLREEKEQHPSQNATAGGPDVGQTPANAPGMSHA